MKRYLVIIIILLGFRSANAQSDTVFRELRVIRGDILSFTVDNLDNIYTIDSRNQLKKFSANGDSVAVYNDVKQYGVATLTDVSNPLKILLYYRDFSTVVELDRFLNPVNVIDLRKHQVFQARAIGQAYDNAIWVFDEQEHKLKKLTHQGRLERETPDLRLVLGKALSPVRIFDENRSVFVYDTTHGVYVFDYFGTLRNNILLQGWDNFTVAGKYIFGSRAGMVLRYEIRTFRLDEWTMPAELKNSQAFRFSSSRLYALRENEDGTRSIHIYDIL